MPAASGLYGSRSALAFVSKKALSFFHEYCQQQLKQLLNIFKAFFLAFGLQESYSSLIEIDAL